MNSTKRIAVIGGGSWATALCKLLSNNVETVQWWIRDKEQAEYLNKYNHNPKYLSSIEFHEGKLKISTDLGSTLSSSDVIILAVPSAFLKDALKGITPGQLKEKLIFSAIKGIIPDQNLIVADFLQQEFNVPEKNIGVITGPCHAEEVAMEKLSYLTIASQNTDAAGQLAKALGCRYLKTVVSDDIYGTEFSAVLKNVFALASGICHGLGYGDNFQAVLISNAIREIKRFVDAVHPIDRDIKDSAYLGDLLVTAYSQFSRNRMFGNMVGKGYSVKYAQLEMNMIAEGYYAARCIFEINKKYRVEMPIAEAVYRILYEKVSPVIEIKLLTDKLS